MNLYVIWYKSSVDGQTYDIWYPTGEEQAAGKHRILASVPVSWMTLGVVPGVVLEEYGPSVPPIPLYHQALAA